VVRGSAPTIGYIPLQIYFTITPITVPSPQKLYCWVWDIELNITTPLQSSTQAASSLGTFPSSSSSSSSPSTTIPIGVVVGAIVGAVVFIALLVIALLLFRKRREREKGHIADTITFTEPENHQEPLSHEGEGPIQLPWVGLNSGQLTPVGMAELNDRLTTPWNEGIASSTPSGSFLYKAGPSTGLVVSTTSGVGSSGQQSLGPNGLPTEIPPNTGRPISIHSSSLSAMPDYPPPIYGLEESVRQDRTMPPSLSPELAQFASTSRVQPPSSSPELARFASANRDVINETLEAKLHAAGYLPTDDPNGLTPEQWRNEHGVNRLELNRLKNLYAR